MIFKFFTTNDFAITINTTQEGQSPMLRTLVQLAFVGAALYDHYSQEQRIHQVLEYCRLQSELLEKERAENGRVKEEYLSVLAEYMEVMKRVKDLAELESLREKAAAFEAQTQALRAELTGAQIHYADLQDRYLNMQKTVIELLDSYSGAVDNQGDDDPNHTPQTDQDPGDPS